MKRYTKATAVKPVTNKQARARRTTEKMLKSLAQKQLPPKKFQRYVELLISTSMKNHGGRVGAALLGALGSERIAAQAGKVYANMIQAPEGDFMGTENLVPAISEESTRMLSGSNRAYFSTIHKTKFYAGQEPTRVNYRLGRTNGVSKLCIADTLRNGLDTTTRQALTLHTGFNQKMQAFMDTDYFGFNFKNISDEFDLTSVDDPVGTQQTAYGALHNLTTKMKITNINKYLPVNVKIYLVKYMDFSRAWESLVDSCSNITLVPATQVPNAMPVYNQVGFQVSDAISSSVLVDPLSNGVLSAGEFKGQCEIVRTFKKKLSSGDIWEFNYVHECGPGIRLDRMRGYQKDSVVLDKFPITYAVMVEFWGPQVEGYRADSSAIRYLGTGPATLNFESRKEITGVNTSLGYDDAANTGTNKGYLSRKWYTRVFTKDVKPHADNDRIVNYNFSDIVAGSGTSSQLIIPIMSGFTQEDVGERT